MELLFVTIIILALTSLSSPLFKRTYDDIRFASCANDMASLMRLCQKKAVFERSTYRFNINADKGTYQVLIKEEEEGKGQEEDNYRTLKSRWGRSFRVSEGIKIETGAEAVDFFPDGTATSASIYITNKEGKAYTISVGQETGIVSVYEGKKE